VAGAVTVVVVSTAAATTFTEAEADEALSLEVAVYEAVTV